MRTDRPAYAVLCHCFAPMGPPRGSTLPRVIRAVGRSAVWCKIALGFWLVVVVPPVAGMWIEDRLHGLKIRRGRSSGLPSFAVLKRGKSCRYSTWSPPFLFGRASVGNWRDMRRAVAFLDPHSPLSEIPETAWLHFQWRSIGADVVLEAPSGTRIYDARVRYPVAAIDPDQPTTENSSFEDPAAQNIQVAAGTLEPNEAFDSIVADHPGDVPWSLDRYSAALAASRLSFIQDTLRVPGVSIAKGGEILRSAGSPFLRNILLVRRFCLEEKPRTICGHYSH